MTSKTVALKRLDLGSFEPVVVIFGEASMQGWAEEKGFAKWFLRHSEPAHSREQHRTEFIFPEASIRRGQRNEPKEYMRPWEQILDIFPAK
jgi:hypothetical protein